MILHCVILLLKPKKKKGYKFEKRLKGISNIYLIILKFIQMLDWYIKKGMIQIPYKFSTLF